MTAWDEKSGATDFYWGAIPALSGSLLIRRCKLSKWELFSFAKHKKQTISWSC